MNKSSPRLRPTWKTWKFYLVFFTIIGVSFISFEYAISYYVVNGIALHTPVNAQREYSDLCYGLRCTPVAELWYCLMVPIVSQALPNGIATGFFGLASVNLSDQDFSLSVNSYQLDANLPESPNIGCSLILAGSNAWQYHQAAFGTSNQTIMNALNNTISSMTVTMTGTFRTNLYTQQITRSTTFVCNFGPIDSIGHRTGCIT